MASVINIKPPTGDDVADILQGGIDEWLRPVCFDLMDEMSNRIHQRGLASDGNKIGKYSNKYLMLRERKYNIPSGKTDIVLYLTSKLLNSWAVIATAKGWAVGFTDAGATEGVTALNKIRFVEENKGKKIGDLTENESRLVEELLNDYVQNFLNNQT